MILTVVLAVPVTLVVVRVAEAVSIAETDRATDLRITVTVRRIVLHHRRKLVPQDVEPGPTVKTVLHPHQNPAAHLTVILQVLVAARMGELVPEPNPTVPVPTPR